MNQCEQVLGPDRRCRLLPPGGLLLSLAVQVPLIVRSWPLRLAAAPGFAGVVLLAGGVGLNLWADRLFHKHGVGVVPFTPAPALIGAGPFRITRNPMYLGMVSISAAAALATGVYLNLVAATVLAVWLHFRFVLPEEEFLRERLGAEYLLYASRNPRWLGFCPSTRKDSACRGPRPGPRLAKAPAAAGRTA